MNWSLPYFYVCTNGETRSLPLIGICKGGGLKNPEFVKYVEDKLDVYIQINTTLTNFCIRWEAFEAYIRGQIISFRSNKNNKQKAEIREAHNIFGDIRHN